MSSRQSLREVLARAMSAVVRGVRMCMAHSTDYLLLLSLSADILLLV